MKQSTINAKLSKAYKEKHSGAGIVMCECCGVERAQDNDHSISQRRCKELGKVELIWDLDNFVSSCRKCHMEFESYKSGEFKKHLNYNQRMNYIKKHDIEGYSKRL